MSNQETIAIARRTVTVSITFAGKPSEDRRKALKDAGYKFENGSWYRSETVSNLATDAEVAKIIAA
jgi:hypothetical protein